MYLIGNIIASCEKKVMAETKYILKTILEWSMYLLWGYTFVDVINLPILKAVNLSTVGSVLEETIKLFASLLGLVYFAMRIRQFYLKSKLENEAKQLENRKAQYEIDNAFLNGYKENVRQKRLNGEESSKKPNKSTKGS